jgi:hypothetical protein
MTPGIRGVEREAAYFFVFRRRTNAALAVLNNPAPRSTSVPGSGTEVHASESMVPDDEPPFAAKPVQAVFAVLAICAAIFGRSPSMAATLANESEVVKLNEMVGYPPSEKPGPSLTLSS